MELWTLFPIILKGYDANYALWYENEAASLLHHLHAEGIFRINHIGSTSVEGLIAKPIVDILLEFKEGYDRKTVKQMLQSQGWMLMAESDQENTIDLNKGYTLQGFAERVYHLHVKPAGDWGELHFRDYLREHADVAGEYGQLKLSLKEKFSHNRDAYTNAKSDFVQQYTQAARSAFGCRYHLGNIQDMHRP